MFSISLLNSLATYPRLNDALRSAAERLAAQELPALASVVTEPHLMRPAFLVARGQTTYPTRIRVLRVLFLPDQTEVEGSGV
jgi:hypothetical protein